MVLERELAMRTATRASPSGTASSPAVPSRSPYTMGTWRDAHGERFTDRPLGVTPTADGVEVERRYPSPAPASSPDGQWWCGAYHREEAARGLNPTEDLCHVGIFSADLDALGATMEIVAWGRRACGPRRAATAGRADGRGGGQARKTAAAGPAGEAGAASSGSTAHTSLALAAGAFVVVGPAGPDAATRGSAPGRGTR